ncbi:MAG: ATP-binding cassette domain-containing protein [Polaromonas sp.]|nr:ATP-binding cassette domain-containing protein [Polaromonas sp.]
MQALRIICEQHANLSRLATTIDFVAEEIEGGSKVNPVFFQSLFEYIEQFVNHCLPLKEGDCSLRALRLRSPDADAILDPLQEEHRNGQEILRALRGQTMDVANGQLASPAFAAALRIYTTGLKSRIRIERQFAMPLAREVLTAEDWAQIDRAFLANEDPLLGDKVKAQFPEILHRIAHLATASVGAGGQTTSRSQASSPPVGSDVLLRVSEMESCYGRIKALKGINLEVRRGETVALVGANGAGKTTFLRAVSGVQPMSAGSIDFDGEDISKVRSDMRMRRGICQSPEGRQVFRPLSIEDNLRLGAYTQPKHQIQGDLERVFSMFPILKEKRLLPAGTLSGGQQQMLAIGRALMGRPKLLLLDEPSMGLAPLMVRDVFNVIKTLKDQGMTILLVEQNAFAALAISDRGYVLETGHITLTGTGRELTSNEQVRAAYLGM